MINIDLIKMLGNLSQSLLPVQSIIFGLAYLLGLIFIVASLFKFKQIAESHGSGQQTHFGAITYLLGGAGLLYSPSMIRVLSNTTFGSGNILAYTTLTDPYHIYASMTLLIHTAGLIWFVRGASLVIHSSNPGSQHGPKGFVFLFAGILAINFKQSIAALNYFMVHLMTWNVPQ